MKPDDLSQLITAIAALLAAVAGVRAAHNSGRTKKSLGENGEALHDRLTRHFADDNQRFQEVHRRIDQLDSIHPTAPRVAGQ